MNGTRIALVLGLAGLAGLGLATPGMLGTGAKLESAVPHPSAEPTAQAAPAPASCTLVAEAAPVPECTAAAAEPAALAQAPVQPQAQAPRVGRVIYPVERPVATSASTTKNTAAEGQSRIAPQQRKVLAQKQAKGQLADGKVLPVGISAKEQGLQAAERKRAGFAPESSVASRGSDAAPADGATPATKSGTEAGKAEGMLIRSGKAPVQKLPPPK